MSLGSLRAVVLAGVGVLLLVLLTAGVTLAGTVPALRRAEGDRLRISAASDASAQLLSRFVDAETGVRGYLLAGQPDFLAPYRSAQAALPALERRLRSRLDGEPRAVRALDDTLAAYRQWQVDYARGQVALVDAGQTARARALTADGKRLFDRLRAKVGALQAVLDAQMTAADRRVRQREDQLTTLLIAALTTLVVLVVTGSVLLLRGVVRPLDRLAAASRRTAPDLLDVALPVGGPAEVRDVAADVEAMRVRLAEEVARSRRAVEALTQHSPAVVALRDALSPARHDVAGLDVAGRLDPAEGILAGDWFDTIQVSDTRLALVLGDVAGHGAASAVFALRLKTSLAAALRAGGSPAGALRITAADLGDVPPEMFATALVAVVDTAAGTLTCANAGHPAGVVLTRPTAAPETVRPGERPRLLAERDGTSVTWRELPATGPLLSPLVQTWAWGELQHRFGSEDTLIAYTDGITETRNGDGEQYGAERLMALLAGSGSHSAARLVEVVANDTLAFAAEQRPADDRTILCVRRQPDAVVPVQR